MKEKKYEVWSRMPGGHWVKRSVSATGRANALRLQEVLQGEAAGQAVRVRESSQGAPAEDE